jgi:RNA polymerase sigma-70 factor (ECF subfamily)
MSFSGKTVGSGERDRKPVTPGSVGRCSDVSALSDAELVRRLKRGDPAGFDAAYSRYRTRIFSFLLRMSRDRALAEDLLQETWVRLATRSTDLADDTHLGGWLFTVARNLFRSHCRWAALDAERVGGLEPAAGAAPPTPHEWAQLGETERRLEDAIGGLAPKVREAVLLVAVEGLSPSRAAEIVGASPEAMRQRLSRGRALLTKALEPGQTRRTS